MIDRLLEREPAPGLAEDRRPERSVLPRSGPDGVVDRVAEGPEAARRIADLRRVRQDGFGRSVEDEHRKGHAGELVGVGPNNMVG